MAQKVKVTLNSKGVRSLLKSTEMQKLLAEKCMDIAKDTDSEWSVYVAGTRSVGEINSNGVKNGTKMLRSLKHD